MSKQEVLSLINSLPDDVSLERILYELYVISNIHAGLNDLKEGRIFSHEEVRKMFA